jgi:hypothetical protein
VFRVFAVLVLAAAVLFALPGRSSPQPDRVRTAAPPPEPTPKAERRERARPKVPRVHCAGCVSVRGRILYVERVDPDGDGDLHVVVLDGSVTAPGATAVDVAPELRPRRDPRPGELFSAAGPVQTGSYGQSQIHALKLRTE